MSKNNSVSSIIASTTTMLSTSTQSTIVANISTSFSNYTTSTTLNPLGNNTTLNMSQLYPWNGWPTVGPITVPTIVYTPNYGYYSDVSYYYFFIIVFLFCIGLIVATIMKYRRQQMLKQAAIRRVQQHAVATGASSNATTVPPASQEASDDLPPTYSEVMQSYINTKESIEVDAVQTGMTAASSTVTIETNISTINLAPTTPNPLPPTYESTVTSGDTTIVITEEQR